MRHLRSMWRNFIDSCITVIKGIAVIIIILMVLGNLTGCGCSLEDAKKIVNSEEGAPVTHTVYIVDRTLYAPIFDNKDFLKEIIASNYTAKGSTASVIAVSGIGVETNKYKGASSLTTPNRIEKNKKAAASEVIELINEALPKEEEADIISAVNLGIDELNSYNETNSVKKMIIFTSGLQTVAPMNLTEGIDTIDINKTVNNICESCVIREGLKNIDFITVYGLGQVNPHTKQEELTGKEKVLLETLYTAIFISNGLNEKALEFNSKNQDGVKPKSNLNVSLVKVFKESSIKSSKSTIDLKNKAAQFDETKMLFKPNTAQFVDKNKAKDVLKPIADWAIANPNEHICIFSSTASCGTKEELEELSLKRSKAVKKVLGEMGCTTSKIKTYALGYEKNPDRVKDVIDGVFVEKLGALNRASYITTNEGDAFEKYYRALKQ